MRRIQVAGLAIGALAVVVQVLAAGCAMWQSVGTGALVAAIAIVVRSPPRAARERDAA